MDFETYLTEKIRKAVKGAIRSELDGLKDEMIMAVKSHKRSRHSEVTSKSRIIRPDELAEMLSLSKVTLYRMQNEGELPPKINISSRAVGWLRSDIEEWLLSKKNSPKA